ncbi:unnamed protein product [Brassicogethes aeneus]|uniref:Cytochrome P450 4aa1 n=1 Tax=Brassicogethes aeneus TaxID=1431903 RepID=A0A9P0FBT9_BRAAE|nr:unnamed protein product [Brassicogethes aeneus]
MERIKVSLLIFIVLVILLTIYLKDYIRRVFLALTIPKAIPFLGSVLVLKDSKATEYLGTYMSQLYGRISCGWAYIIPFIFLYEPEHLQEILSNSKRSEKNLLYKILHNFLGIGLITENGHKWKFHRKLIQPLFHINVLELYIHHFIQGSQEFLKHLKDKENVKITFYINNLIIGILHRSMLGVEQTEDSPFRKGQTNMLYRLTRPWLLLDNFFKFTSAGYNETNQKCNLFNYTKNILDEKIKSGKRNPEFCLMDALIEVSRNNQDFTYTDVINEICTFMLAGQDSSGAALAFLFYFIAKHKDIQEKIWKEQKCIFENVHSNITMNDLNKMKYLEQCIKETLRIYPSVPMMARVLKEDLTLDKKYCIPKGTNIIVSPLITHRLPHIFKDPLKFDPDRFSEENIKDIHPYAYLPFSLGNRQCIGYKFAIMEIKTVTSILLRNYHISLLDKTKDIHILYRVTLRIKEGVWLHLKPRNCSKFV